MAYSMTKGVIMMTINFWKVACCTVMLAIAYMPSVAEADVPIKINTYGIHQNGQVTYRYQIENNSSSIVYKADLGLDTSGKELPGLPWSRNPNYSDVPVPLDAASCKPFYGMVCAITVFQFDYMSEPKTNITMDGIESNMVPPPTVFSGKENIQPGTRSSIAELYIPKAYQSIGYLTSYGKVYLLDDYTRGPDGKVIISAEIPFTLVDTNPPTLNVTLNPATLWPPNNMPVMVTATISTNDDYDPEPEIKLESITASEPLADGDIQDAQLLTDDRSFSLVAKRDGNNMAGRIYTITYSATDASGNKATASATVTVPHDQGK